MAADAAKTGADEPYTWVRCECGAGLWRLYADRLEMTVSPRGGQKRTISVPVQAASAVSVKCEKCGLVSVPAEDERRRADG